MNIKNEEMLSREQMKNIMAGSGTACMYYVSGGWTRRLNGCTTTTVTGSGSFEPGGVGGSGSVSVTEERCCYDAYDPYNMGYSGERCVNGAVARQC